MLCAMRSTRANAAEGTKRSSRLLVLPVLSIAFIAAPLAAAEFFGQRAEASDIAVVLLLILLEGLLSIDNALVLGLLARRLPTHQQKKALTYGLIGAMAFRIIAIFMAALLLKLPIMKLLGGGYLIFVALKHFCFERKDGDADKDSPIPGSQPRQEYASFWATVLIIETTDIAFALDSILAALAFIPASTVTPNPKLWVVVTGGMLGVILMRFAAVFFIKLLDRFPRFEISAYLLVSVIGLKLCLDWYFNARPPDWPLEQAFHGPLDFHNPGHFAFWIFWASMAACFASGFLPARGRIRAN